MGKNVQTQVANAMVTALKSFNSDYGTSWTYGSNWNSVGTQFETFINNYFFPKITETKIIAIDLGNRFDFIAKDMEFIGQYSEEYVIADSVPISMNLSKSAELMLARNYPKMITKFYGSGQIKKQKFTLNNNDVRLNFTTLADGVEYAMAVYRKKISDINVLEEQEIKGMLVDYSLNHVKDRRSVASNDDFFNEVYTAILNIQNNSHAYNESDTASGGAISRYTTFTKLTDVVILTTDRMKTFLLDTKIANTFQIKGLDISDRVISFDDLGGIYKTSEEIVISDIDTINFLRGFGDYQVEIGDIIPKHSVFTFDVTTLTEFVGKVSEIKPDNDRYALIFDISKLRYKRFTKDMLKKPFYNGEYDEVTYWLHYYSSKSISPFYNSVLVH